MSTYVMSDIHGCYDEFMYMLKLIKFNNIDSLYILGDVLDKGPKSVEVLDYIIDHKNIFLIKGNHEKMFEEYFESGFDMIWYWGGKEIKGGYEKEKIMYKYIKNLPFIKVLDKYILVHAGLDFPEEYNELELEDFLNQNEETVLWNRDNIGSEKQYRDYTIICGHTPVQFINNNIKEPQIIKRNGTIYIDCGCCYKEKNGRLACLRIDDNKEFYISKF